MQGEKVQTLDATKVVLTLPVDPIQEQGGTVNNVFDMEKLASTIMNALIKGINS